MAKQFKEPTKEQYTELRRRLQALQLPVEVRAAEMAVIKLDMVRRKGRLTFRALLPFAQKAVEALSTEHPHIANVAITVAALERAFFRVARRPKENGNDNPSHN